MLYKDWHQTTDKTEETIKSCQNLLLLLPIGHHRHQQLISQKNQTNTKYLKEISDIRCLFLPLKIYFLRGRGVVQPGEGL